ncbi:MAG: nucleotide exchange factor GrpE [Patescibacteria group bacterium]
MTTAAKGSADGQGKGSSGARQDPKAPALEGKIAELAEQVKKLTDLAGRAQADLQNAKARMEKSGEEFRKFASEALLLKLLPTIDNFQRAFQHLPAELKTNEWVRGVSAIEQDLMRQLHDMGLRKMESLGTPVDAAKHEVLTTGPGEEGKVIEVFEEGYALHGKVLRPAKVKAGSHPLE